MIITFQYYLVIGSDNNLRELSVNVISRFTICENHEMRCFKVLMPEQIDAAACEKVECICFLTVSYYLRILLVSSVKHLNHKLSFESSLTDCEKGVFKLAHEA